MKESRLVELQQLYIERLKEWDVRYKQLKPRSKEELIAILSQTMRVHGLDTRDSKMDIIVSILDRELGIGSLAKKIRRAGGEVPKHR